MGEMGLIGVVVFFGVLLCFLANWLETSAIYRRHPEWRRDFLYQTSRSVAMCVLLLLFLGWAGHNLLQVSVALAGGRSRRSPCIAFARRAAAGGKTSPRRMPHLFGQRPALLRPATPFA